jgi:hypothetical protein
VIDGLTPAVLERAIETGATPALAYLAGEGTYRRAVSTFPSLTPVCMSSIATGTHPDVHGIPHLVWYHRGERRLVEYGSSFGAILAAGTKRSILDTIFELNERHLSREAVTVYEALDDAGLVPAAVNVTCYRGRTRHRPTVPGLARAAFGPKRFFYYNLFESDPTGAPFAVRNRAGGTVDEYAAAVGRWLVTRDGFDFLLYYLSDYDYASHATGPAGADAALARADEAVASLLDSAGGWDEFLERYAVVLCSDHGQTPVSQAVRLQDAFADLPLLRRGGRGEVAVTASNRAGMIYRLPGCRAGVRDLAERLDGQLGVELTLFLEDGEPVARRNGVEDIALLDEYPQGRQRAAAALRNPNAGEVIVSAALDYEFVDLGGRHHSGGGSHGSLVAGDSEVPMLSVGAGEPPDSITGLAPLVLRHFGI